MGTDPRWVLDAAAEDWPIVEAVLQAAVEHRQKYDEGLAKYVAFTTSNRTIAGVGKTLRSLMAAWARSQRP